MEETICRNREKTSDRKGYIDIFRCIGILCMIIGHTALGGHRMDHYIHAFHMPMFFVVSGYFFRSGKLRKTLMKLFTAYATLGLFHYAIWLGINRGGHEYYCAPKGSCLELHKPGYADCWGDMVPPMPCLGQSHF